MMKCLKCFSARKAHSRLSWLPPRSSCIIVRDMAASTTDCFYKTFTGPQRHGAAHDRNLRFGSDIVRCIQLGILIYASPMRKLMRVGRLVAFIAALAVVSHAQQAPEKLYAGSTVCKTCHPDIWLKFYKNAHFKSVASGKEKPADTGCEGCHGPAAAHVKAHGGKATIISFFNLTPKQTIDACLK